jgi:hypothetical protein
MMFMVIDHEFNQTNYPELINRFYSNPPAYAIVKTMPDAYRNYECHNCNSTWIAKVELDKNTINLSGEKTEYCPNCNKKPFYASAWIQSNGNPFPFPEPIKPTN